MTLTEAIKKLKAGRGIFRPGWADIAHLQTMLVIKGKGEFYYQVFAVRPSISDNPIPYLFSLEDVEADDWKSIKI